MNGSFAKFLDISDTDVVSPNCVKTFFYISLT